MNIFKIRAVKLYDEHPRQDNYRLHIHDECEILYFLSGDAMYNVEGNMYSLLPGDILLLKNTESHNLILNSEIPYERITVHFQVNDSISEALSKVLLAPVLDRPIGQYNLYPYKEFSTMHWRYYLECICKEADTIRQQIYLMTFLQEISEAFPLLKEQNSPDSIDRILQITHYIDRHLAEPLSIKRICSRFYISEAQLTRHFKKKLGTTVGEYILTKRLLLAHNLIKKGTKPTTAYLQCGFRDYSVFYRAYKKKFGRSPKEHRVDPVHLERIDLP